MATTIDSLDRGPLVTFARFENRKVTIFKANTKMITYFAISHVWGAYAWRKVDGVDGNKLISKEKADFVENHLLALVGNTPFWMDTLTVNQRDPQEVLATVAAIPDIFRDAVRTIAIRECDGFYNCCQEALKDIKGWHDFNEKVTTHNKEHYGHLREESYLRRLWTLQEILLSHTVQFTVSPKNEPLPSNETGPKKNDAYSYRNDVAMLADSLWVLAFSFSTSDERDTMEGINEFIKAYINCGITSRKKQPVRTMAETIHTIDGGFFRLVNLASNRSAKMPRDYIFATMEQFPWYHFPPNAVNMSFSSIFIDLYDQSAANRHRFAPRVLQSMTDPNASGEQAWRPSDQQPEPACLGDFLKLAGRRLAPTTKQLSGPAPQSSTHLTGRIPCRLYDNESHEVVLWVIEAAMKLSVQAWEEAHQGGELSKFGSFPEVGWELNDLDAIQCGWMPKSFEKQLRVIDCGDRTILVHGKGTEYEEMSTEGVDWSTMSNPVGDSPVPQASSSNPNYVTLFQQARKILDHMWCAVNPRRVDPGQRSDWEAFKRSMVGSWPQPLLRTMLLLSAMIGCGIGLSADKWCNARFVPCYAGYGDEVILGLLAKHARSGDTAKPQAFIGAGKHVSQESFCTDLVLVDRFSMLPVGLLPDFLPHHSHHTWSDELFAQRTRMLYGGLVIDPSPRNLQVRVIPLDKLMKDDSRNNSNSNNHNNTRNSNDGEGSSSSAQGSDSSCAIL